MSGWRDMSDAPRDGTRIIGWFGDRCIVVFWRSGPEYVKNGVVSRATGNTVWYWSDGYSRYREPDCWQPEPEAPDAAQFPTNAPPPKPRGPTSPAARRRREPQRRVREKPRPVITQALKVWCAQCELSLTREAAERCTSPFCKAKATAA